MTVASRLGAGKKALTGVWVGSEILISPYGNE